MNDIFVYAKENGIDKLQITKRECLVNAIESKNDIITDISYGEDVYYDVKAIYNNKTVKFTVSTMDAELICNRIKKLALLIENVEEDAILANGKIDCEHKKYDMDISNYSNKFMDIYKKYKSDNVKMIECSYEKVINRIRIENSNGVCLNDESKNDMFYMSVTCNDDNNIVSYDKLIYNPSDVMIDRICDEVVKTAMDKLDQGKVTSSKYKVLIDSRTMASIFGPFIDMFSAEEVFNKNSLLCGKLNDRIMSSKISIVEDPTNEKLVGKCLFDSEGTLTYKKDIVSGGVLKTYLHSVKSANRDGVKPTGNMFGDISARNMYIVPGVKSEEELIREMDNGVFINTVIGTHVGINIVTGVISLQAEGYKICDGKKDKAIKQFVLSTDFDTLFNNVMEVGNNLEFNNKAFGSPSILFDNISIVG